jgi:hypothetical protein
VRTDTIIKYFEQIVARGLVEILQSPVVEDQLLRRLSRDERRSAQLLRNREARRHAESCRRNAMQTRAMQPAKVSSGASRQSYSILVTGGPRPLINSSKAGQGLARLPQPGRIAAESRKCGINQSKELAAPPLGQFPVRIDIQVPRPGYCELPNAGLPCAFYAISGNKARESAVLV